MKIDLRYTAIVKKRETTANTGYTESRGQVILEQCLLDTEIHASNSRIVIRQFPTFETVHI